jgi:hypothetical protein
MKAAAAALLTALLLLLGAGSGCRQADKPGAEAHGNPLAKEKVGPQAPPPGATGGRAR